MPKKAAPRKQQAVAEDAPATGGRGKRKVASEAEPAARKKGDTVGDLFEKYKDPAEDRIGPEGVEALCKDLGISPTSMTCLILAWKLGAEEMGYFKREELVNGCQNLGVSDLASLNKTLASIERDLKITSPAFTDLYKYAFTFCCDKNNKKSVDIETAASMLDLVLANGPHTKKFVEFLGHTKTYKVINKDQWLCFLEFSRNVKGDLSNHDDNEAWPLLIDEYVEYVRNSK